MPSLYPTTLFHFTKREAFFSILRSTFRLSYAKERIVAPKSTREIGVPMVSFCDIKMADLKYFIEKDYGNFGIGLTKEWANRKSLTPVMYINRHCTIADSFNEGLRSIYATAGSKANEKLSADQSYLKLTNMYRYIKNYEGELERDGKTIPNYRFADEREWRFVPPIETENIAGFVSINKIKTKSKKREYNQQVSHIRLNFQPEDIKYLIVEKEDDIIELINHLDDVKSRFTPDTRRTLASRILTLDQIKNDF